MIPEHDDPDDPLYDPEDDCVTAAQLYNPYLDLWDDVED